MRTIRRSAKRSERRRPEVDEEGGGEGRGVMRDQAGGDSKGGGDLTGLAAERGYERSGRGRRRRLSCMTNRDLYPRHGRIRVEFSAHCPLLHYLDGAKGNSGAHDGVIFSSLAHTPFVSQPRRNKIPTSGTTISSSQPFSPPPYLSPGHSSRP